MPSILNSDDGVVSGTSGLKTTGGNDGILALQNNGTTNVTVTAAGNVGIGTSSPAGKLDVSGSSGRFYVGSAGDAIQFTLGGSNYIGANTAGGQLVLQTAGQNRVVIDSSGNLQFNSGYGSVATAYGCRAWVNFNGATNAIRTSGNVSSITDQGTGIWQISFSTNPPDANYSVQCLTSGQYNAAHTLAYVGAGNQDFAGYVPPAPTTSSFYILTCNPVNGGQRAEGTQMMVSVFR